MSFSSFCACETRKRKQLKLFSLLFIAKKRQRSTRSLWKDAQAAHHYLPSAACVVVIVIVVFVCLFCARSVLFMSKKKAGDHDGQLS